AAAGQCDPGEQRCDHVAPFEVDPSVHFRPPLESDVPNAKKPPERIPKWEVWAATLPRDEIAEPGCDVSDHPWAAPLGLA
ncbi:MAG TPA: hypothetical protein PK823_13670, partial [Novosphingobium sp.]|nr:hypothetical protein [Novosphingobium sp.]